ncbi:hypothetical protein OG895_13170 [Streptomyces sp. NBC_00201]|uniref:hypothetical protein n=1 Tax=unclassified Streptomyces TaxID=2593676 RepID=UPI00225164B2|nr:MULTISPECIES: hypothetical protein [unclassified Streptomyces]MCX5246178.1 hypothetical protein [Streptomyces sp. NBC_00201]
MTEKITRLGGTPVAATALRTPYQTPAVDRNPAASHTGRNGAEGVEADLSWSDIPWRSLGQAAKGALDAVL